MVKTQIYLPKAEPSALHRVAKAKKRPVAVAFAFDTHFSTAGFRLA
jgi:hypothetical protein